MSSKSFEEPFAWLEALLANNDFAGAERLVKNTPPDCERVYSLLLLAKAYFKNEKLKIAGSRSAQAVTLWKVNQTEWWALIILGDLLQGLAESGQSMLAECLIGQTVRMIERKENAWLETHGWCGLALGAISLGRKDDSEKFFAQASEAAESRPTPEGRYSAMSLVDMALKSLK